MACGKKRSADNRFTFGSKRYIYKAVILILARVTGDGDIRRSDVETVSLCSR
jgi:hypothetical protein